MHNNPFGTGFIGGMQVKNRFVRSATHENIAHQGIPSSDFVQLYRSLAEGEVGTIITGFMGFSEFDNLAAGTVDLRGDAAISRLKELVAMVHAYGTKIVAQIGLVGPQLLYPPTAHVYGPSSVPDPISGIVPTPLSTAQIKIIITEFGLAAQKLKECGFDAVQLHGAHGYMLSKFLSPLFNKRTDKYGGCPENNSQILLEILAEIKAMCGKDYPVWIKMNCADFDKVENGFSFEDALIAAKLLSQNGIDAIELSGGSFAGKFSPCRSASEKSYHLEYAKSLAELIDTPVILVGGNRSIDMIEHILNDTNIQAISMARPLIREPFLVKRWLDGDRRDATCTGCTGCLNPSGTRCFFVLEGDEKKTQK